MYSIIAYSKAKCRRIADNEESKRQEIKGPRKIITYLSIHNRTLHVIAHQAFPVQVWNM